MSAHPGTNAACRARHDRPDPRPRRGAIAALGNDAELDGSRIAHTLRDETEPLAIRRVASLPKFTPLDSSMTRSGRVAIMDRWARSPTRLVHPPLFEPGSENGLVVRRPVAGKHPAPSPPAHQMFPAVEVTNGHSRFTAGEGSRPPVDVDPVRVRR